MPENPTFTLRIRVMGLALFAYEAPRMYVLMPGIKPGGHHHAIDPHMATIYFDSKYNADSTSSRDREAFDNCSWDLSLLRLNSADSALPPPIINVEPHTKRPFNKHHLTAPPKGRVHSRLVFGSGGWRCHGDTADFTLAGHPVTLSNWLEWEIKDVPGATLEWTFDGMNDKTGRTPPPLAPHAGVIEMDIIHAPSGDHVDRYDHGTCDGSGEAEHFLAYYDLFGVARGKAPVCVPGSIKPGKCRDEAGRKGRKRERGGKVYTCMLATSTVA